MCMHTNEDIWEIRQITMRKGMRMTKEAKEITMGMMVATIGVMMEPVMSQVVIMTRAAMTMGLVTTVTTTGPAATISI